MTKLKLGAVLDDRPVKITVELPATLNRDLIAYADILTKTTGAATPIDPSKLIVPMLERFMATDRSFSKARKPKNSA
ncbi:DUF2274 domain-containing protein [Acidocella facilis]|uniref:DUF2274 domain-containing protein n=1 Tax=Acidocella facilis TaxID=525 RepID=UPI001F229C50|nr:DUF2274 domain-containing protein [Acidocella facilis]